MLGIDCQTMIDAMPAGVMVYDAEGTIVATNHAASRLLGASGDQLRGRSVDDLSWQAIDAAGLPYASARHPVMCALREGLVTTDAMISVTNLTTAQPMWLRVSVAPLTPSGASRAAFALTTFDVIPDADAPAAPPCASTMIDTAPVRPGLQSPPCVETILDACPIGILLLDAGLMILSANQHARLLFGGEGWDGAQAVFTAYLRERDAEAVRNAAATVLADQAPCELDVVAVRSDGTTFEAELTIGCLTQTEGEPRGLVCAISDITAWRQAADALQNSEDRWRFALEGSGDGIWDWNLVTGEVFYSERWKNMLGYTDGEIGSSLEDWQRHIHPEDRPHVLAAVAAHLKGATPVYECEHRMLARLGDYRWILDRGQVVRRDGDGRPLRFIGTHADITGRKRIEMALTRQSELLRILMETALHFINVPVSQIDPGIVDVLGSVGRFNEADRAYIFDYDFDRGTLHNSYEWCAPGIAPQIDQLQNGRLEDYAEWVSAHQAKRTIYIPDVLALSVTDPLRLVLEPQGIKSLIAIPLTDGDQCLGFIGFDAVRAQRVWSDTDIVLLKLLAELIVNAKRRMRDDAALRRTTQRLAMSERRLRNAQRIARLGAWEYDLDTGRIDWSAETYAIFGRAPSAEKMDYDAFLALLHEADQPILRRVIQRAVEEGSSYEVEARVCRPDGAQCYVLGRGEPEFDDSGRPVRLIGSVLDITDRKQSEIALQRALDRERELGELKSSFVAMASHELRTPLATILAAAETLLAYGDRLEREQLVRRLNKIRDQVAHLQAIISDVLQLTRIEAGTHNTEFEYVEFGAFCVGIIEDYLERPQLERNLRFQPAAAPLLVKIDRRLIRQAINNIVDNAIKYSAPFSRIEIALTAREGMAVLSIRDQGIGIPESGRQHLFEPFQRASNVAMISGTGLGLPITREIVTLHGGTIAIESTVNVGTEVQIQIPLDEDPE